MGQQKLWQIVTVVLISSGVISGVVMSRSQTWWNKYENNANPAIAKIVNQATNPAIITDARISYIISLSYLMEPKVKFQLVVKQKIPNIPKISNNFTEVFFFNPSQKLLSGIKQSQKLERLYQQHSQSLSKLIEASN